MAAIADPVSTDTNCVIRLLPIKCSTERLQHLAYFAPWNTDSTKIILFSRSAIPQGRGILYPIFSSSRQACPEQSRRDAKTAKKTFLTLFLGALCVLCKSYLLSDQLFIAPRPLRPQRKNFSYFSELGVPCPVE